MLYPEAAARDEIYHGRNTILGIGAAFLIAWVAQCLSYPILIVPGFLFDSSLGALKELASLALQFVFFSIFFLLLWAGFGWLRYVFGAYLLVAGTANLILSIMLDARGGVPLLFGLTYLICAGALMLSLGVDRYVKDRQARGIPWLAVGLGAFGLLWIPAGVVAIELWQMRQMMRLEREETSFATQYFEAFAPDLDTGVLDAVLSVDSKQHFQITDFPGQCRQLRDELGPFQNFLPLPVRSLKEVVLNPPSRIREFQTLAYYPKADLVITFEIDARETPWRILQVYVSEVAKERVEKENEGKGRPHAVTHQ